MRNQLLTDEQMPMHGMINRALDRIIRPQVSLWHRSWPTFRVCLVGGLGLGAALTMALALALGLSPWVMASVILTALLAFFTLPLLGTLLTGEETLVYYRHEMMVLGASALLLWFLRQPLLPYLDALILGVGVCLATSRVGCLMAGCCYGRPHAWGACYSVRHADDGFPASYVGVRLFPVQAVESLWVWGVVAIGCAIILGGGPPGAALGWYIAAYAAGRFWLEELAGYTARRFVGGFSEAQWTAAALAVVVLVAQLVGALPLSVWSIMLGGSVPLALVAVALADRQRLLLPAHVAQIVEAAAVLEAEASGQGAAAEHMPGQRTLHLAWTTRGVRISAIAASRGGHPALRYTLGWRDGPLPRRVAHAIARLILQTRHPGAAYALSEADDHVFQLWVAVAPPAPQLALAPQTQGKLTPASPEVPRAGHDLRHIRTGPRAVVTAARFRLKAFAPVASPEPAIDHPLAANPGEPD